MTGASAAEGAPRRRRRLGGRLGAFAVGLALGVGAGVLVGATHGDEGKDGAGVAVQQEEAPALKGLGSSEQGYSLELLTASVAPEAPGEFRFRVIGPGGGAVTTYRELHERPLHLILVSRDLGTFRHMHPSLGGDGVWRVGLDPLPPGPYRAFADFAVVDGPELTLGHDVTVTGEQMPRPVPTASPTADVDGYRVELSGAPKAAGEGEVTLTVRRGGQAVADLEPYLGALGHLVAIRASDLAYLHVHPLDGRAGTGEVAFAVEAPSAGTYRLFFDFSHQGTVRTAAFTIEVPAADAGTPTTAAHRDGH